MLRSARDILADIVCCGVVLCAKLARGDCRATPVTQAWMVQCQMSQLGAAFIVILLRRRYEYLAYTGRYIETRKFDLTCKDYSHQSDY